MNLMDIIANNPQIIGQVASQFGLGESQAKSAINPLLGSIAGAFKQNIASGNGLQALMSALGSGNHSNILENISGLSSQTTTNEGNGILSHLFGGKEGSREVAKKAAQQSGVDYGITKKILPLVASLAMGGLSKQAGSSGLLSMLSGGGTADKNQLSGFASLLDTDGDGSIVDDVIGLASKFLR